MSEVSSTVLDPRTAFRYAVRERAMAAGLAQVKSEGWRQLRINQIAKQIGVSRPTIYAEFGTKEEFAQTLLEREMDTIFGKFEKTLSTHQSNPQNALEMGLSNLISTVQQSPLLSGLLTDDDPEQVSTPTRPANAIGLLPFIDRCSDLLTDWLGQCSTDLKGTNVSQTSDVLARLVLSNIMTPTNSPVHTSKELSELAARLLPGI